MPEPTVDPNIVADNPPNVPVKTGETPNNLPEKFKGKTAEEIANSYLELERKATETNQSYAVSKKQLEDLKALEVFIDSDPESLAFLKERIQNKNGKQIQSRQNIDPEYNQLKQEIVDTKLATQTGIFEKFEGKYGLNDEGVDKEIKHKIGEAVKQMVAPKSTKTPTEIIAGLSLDTLPLYLENAYKLVTMEDQKEQTRRKTLAQMRQNSQATFSSIPSGSIRQDSQTLTTEEKKVAKGLGISEEKYLKQKQAYISEYQQ